jgi:hypothetical protein
LKHGTIVEKLLPFLFNFVPKIFKLLFAFSMVHQLFDQPLHLRIFHAKEEKPEWQNALENGKVNSW